MSIVTRTLTNIALAVAIATGSLAAVVGLPAPASAQPYHYGGYGHYRWHGRYYHHRRWHPAYYGPGRVYHAGFFVYL